MNKVVVLDHPLINHKLTLIRDKNTTTKSFRQLVSEVSSLMAYEITRDLPMKNVTVETPITKTKAKIISKDIVIVPILRAGIGMADGIKMLIPAAKIGHIGLYRDENTLEAHRYYSKLPECIANSTVLVVDPMLATGGSASCAVDIIKKTGAKNIKYVGLVGAPEGVKKLQSCHPNVDIYIGALDEKLNEKGYIVPGLGDCGDRLYGTK